MMLHQSMNGRIFVYPSACVGYTFVTGTSTWR
jgi:hypothetical protein